MIQDPPGTTGLQVYQEFFQSAVGLAGAAGNFDGNGRYMRASAGGGDQFQTQTRQCRDRAAVRQRGAPAARDAPRVPGQGAPLRRDVPCYKNAVPNLNKVTTGAAP